MNLEALLEEKGILVCCGGGGVGKTTAAAAIAIRAASLGYRTLVLTIDPARRLANALGVSEFGNEVREVPPEMFKKAGIPLRGELHAMMLDTKRTFDDLVERFAVNAEMRDAILNNPIYQQLSNTLAGSREYMAMEKLYELHTEGGFDLIILDTPPTRHALDFLDAPDKITDFLEGKVIQFIIRPYLMAGSIGFKIFRRGTTSMFGILEKVTGVEFLRDLSDFVLSFEGMYDGFKQRARRVKALLARRDTGFILVTVPSRMTIDETLFFHEQLVAHKMHVETVIINKVHQQVPRTPPAQPAVASGVIPVSRIGNLAEKVSAAAGIAEFSKAAEKLLQNYNDHQALVEMDARNVELLRAPIPAPVELIEVPRFPYDVHDLGGLEHLNQHLFQA